jgi:cellulose synthase operon protein C
VRELRVLHADGRIESAPPPRRDQTGGGGRFRAYDVPPLAVGDVLDVEYRVDETEPDLFGEYFGVRHVFYADAPDPLAPVARSELVVIAPADVEVYTAERNGGQLERSVETDAQGRTIHRWIARDLARPPQETAMPRREEFAPLVDVSTYASWNDFAKWWWAFIENEFVSTPALKAKVAELTAGLATEHDKVRALARFVGQEIHYNAWEFGPHGYQPYSTATIFERRFGDCKDKSILLVEMLKEIGVDANPVLIDADYARPEEPLRLAMVEHFNHCIAYVKPTPARDGYYLDATADRNPIEYLRSDDQGANVLHVDASGGSIHAIPYAPPEENARRRNVRVELAPGGAAEVRYRDTSNGAFGVQLRYVFGGEKGDLAKRFADTVGEGFGKVEVRRVETSKLEDIGVPVELEAEFHAENMWTREADGAALRLAFERFGLDRVAVEPPADRHFDVVLDRPFLEELDVVYVLPEGARVVELPPKADIRAEGLCSYSLTVEQAGNELHVRRRFRLDERRIPLARYADFRDAVQEIRQAEDRSIRIQPPPLRETGREGGDK